MNYRKLIALGVATMAVVSGTAVVVAAATAERAATTSLQDGTGSTVFECPVTEPPTPGLVPPKPHPSSPDGAGLVWYGTPDLWTALPVDGEYGPRKSVWWSAAFQGGHVEEQPEIEVVWERLDRARAPITNGGAGTNAYTVLEGWFMIAGIDPAEPGCWQVTATYRDTELSYVYERA